MASIHGWSQVPDWLYLEFCKVSPRPSPKPEAKSMLSYAQLAVSTPTGKHQHPRPLMALAKTIVYLGFAIQEPRNIFTTRGFNMTIGFFT